MIAEAGAHRRSHCSYALEPLSDATVMKGAPPPPESFKEVAPVTKAKLRAGRHVAASDSAQAIKKAIKQLKGVPHVVVVHKRKNFAHVVKLPKKYIHKRFWKRAAKLPTTTSKTYRIKAGGNAAEWTFSALKRNMVRMNLARSTTTASVNFLTFCRQRGFQRIQAWKVLPKPCAFTRMRSVTLVIPRMHTKTLLGFALWSRLKMHLS